MALLWENLNSQLDSVRAVSTAPAAIGATVTDDTREQRLQKALAAVRKTGNSQMIESLEAALEGRQANLELPDLPVPGELSQGVSGPEAYLAQIADNFKPSR